MELETLIHRFSDTTENQEKAIFSSIFILEISFKLFLISIFPILP